MFTETQTEDSGTQGNTQESAPSLRERQRQIREEAILDAALELMATVGYDAMTMDDLAERAGISKPTLYQHYRSKEMIAVRSVMRRVEACWSFIDEVDPNLPAIDRIHRIVRWVLENKFIARQTFWPALRAAPIHFVKEQPEYQRLYRRIVERMSAIIDEAKRDGVVEKRRNTRIIAQIVFSLMRDGDYQDILAAGECAPEELVDTLVSFYMAGIEARGDSKGTAS